MDERGAIVKGGDGAVVVIGCESLKTGCQNKKMTKRENTINSSSEE